MIATPTAGRFSLLGVQGQAPSSRYSLLPSDDQALWDETTLPQDSASLGSLGSQIDLGVDQGGDVGGVQAANAAVPKEGMNQPQQDYRNRVVDLTGKMVPVGSGIQPVSRYQGGSQMAGARAAEMLRNTSLYRDKEAAHMGHKVRQMAALGNTVKAGVGIVVDLASMGAFGGAAQGVAQMGGAAKMAGGGGEGGGSGASMAGNYLASYLGGMGM